MARFGIWYMRPEQFRDGIMGVDWCREQGKLPDPLNLDRTHVQLRLISAGDLGGVFHNQQGEVWSPNGEARELIESKGLNHTSMSIGDIAVDEAGIAHVCDRRGWHSLGSVRGA